MLTAGELYDLIGECKSKYPVLIRLGRKGKLYEIKNARLRGTRHGDKFRFLEILIPREAYAFDNFTPDSNKAGVLPSNVLPTPPGTREAGDIPRGSREVSRDIKVNARPLGKPRELPTT